MTGSIKGTCVADEVDTFMCSHGVRASHILCCRPQERIEQICDTFRDHQRFLDWSQADVFSFSTESQAISLDSSLIPVNDHVTLSRRGLKA